MSRSQSKGIKMVVITATNAPHLSDKLLQSVFIWSGQHGCWLLLIRRQLSYETDSHCLLLLRYSDKRFHLAFLELEICNTINPCNLFDHTLCLRKTFLHDQKFGRLRNEEKGRKESKDLSCYPKNLQP